MKEPATRRSLAWQLAALACVLAGLMFGLKGLIGTPDRMDIPLSMMWIGIGMAFLVLSQRHRPGPPPDNGDRAEPPS